MLLTPLIAELERAFKGAEIDILSEGTIATEVFSTFFSVKTIHCLPRRGFKHPLAFLGLLSRIRRNRYDLIIDPCLGSNFSRAMTRLLRGRYKLGFAEPGQGTGLTHCAPRSVAGRHMAKRAINLVRWMKGSGEIDAGEYPSMDIRPTVRERAEGRQQLAAILPTGYPRIGIFANATGRKRYPQTWWCEFIEVVQQRLPEASIVEVVPMHGQSMLDSAWPAYYSSDIRRMGAVMGALDLVISADCGVMHLAVASGVTTVGLFCVTDPAVYAPYGQASAALRTDDLSARECADRSVDACAGLFSRAAVLRPPEAEESGAGHAPPGVARHAQELPMGQAFSVRSR